MDNYKVCAKCAQMMELRNPLLVDLRKLEIVSVAECSNRSVTIDSPLLKQ